MDPLSVAYAFAVVSYRSPRRCLSPFERELEVARADYIDRHLTASRANAFAALKQRLARLVARLSTGFADNGLAH